MSQMNQAFKFWTDAIAPTSLTTGVTKETLNGGNDYNVSAKAASLIEVVAEAVTTGAFTAGESFMLRTIAESDALNLNPKEYVGSFGLGGLGVFTHAEYPILLAKPYNTPLNRATNPITFSGQAQVANTVAPEMSLEVHFSDGPPLGHQQFYIAPNDETSTGTAAGNVAGNDITINGGATINMASVILTPGTVTASESVHGRGQLASTNFEYVPSPMTWQAQPIAAALGTTTSVAIPTDRWVNVNVPIGSSFLGTTSLNLDEALTAAGNFIVQVGYLKRRGAN